MPSLPHGHELMADVLDRRQLAAGTIAIDSDTALSFRAALRGDALVASLPNAAFFVLETAARRDR